MKATKQPIHNLLNMSQQEYCEYYLETYMRWALETARKTSVSFQSILANTKISNWYNDNFYQLEENARQMLATQQHSTTAMARTVYSASIAEMHTKYPSALLTDAKTLNIVNHYAN